MSLKFSRRQFLGYSAAAVALAAAGWNAANRTAGPSDDALLLAANDTGERVVPTVCSLCPASCGLNVRVSGGHAVKVEGNSLHPINQGVCCPKGQASLEMLYSPERVRQPLMRSSRSGEWKNATWDEALGLVAGKLDALRAADQAHTLAFVYGDTRGQERAVIQRLMAAYGSPNAIDASDPDVQAARLAMLMMQGVNAPPVYQFDGTRYVISFGGSLLESSRHLMAALSGAGFMRRGTPNRGKLVVVDPRLSVSAAKADEWVPIRPGTLGALALGIAHIIVKSQLYDANFVRDYAFGFEDFADDEGVQHRGFKNLVLDEYTPARVEAITGVASGTISRLAGEFAASRPAIALLPTGRAALASGNALGAAMAIHALNALVASIDAAGGVIVQRYPQLTALPPFTPGPGANRERIDGAGTSAYPLALSNYWTLAERILGQNPYALNALILCGANPVFDMPGGAQFASALAKVPFVASLSTVLDESAAQADVVLPISTLFESWGDAYVEGTGFAGLALAQPAVGPLYDTRSMGDVLIALAQKLGGSVAAAFPFADYQALVRQRVAGSEIQWQDLVDKGAWSQMVYFNAAPGSRVWNTEIVGRDRVNAPRDGRFDFYSREMLYALKGAGITPDDRDVLPHFDVPRQDGQAAEFPFQLITTETMTQPRGFGATLPTLEEVYGLQVGVRWDSWVEMSSQAAAANGLADGDPVWVESPRGKVKTRLKVVQGLWSNAVAMPLGQGHWSGVDWDRHSGPGTWTGVNVMPLCATETEVWSGLASMAPARVRVYKA